MKKSRLNILYLLADRGHDLTRIQGYTVHVQQILTALRKKNHQPFLLTINDSSDLPGFHDYETLPHRYCRGVHKLLPYTGVVNSARILRRILELNGLRHFDLIHERYGLYSLAGALAAQILDIPHILEVNAPLIEEKQLFSRPMTGAPQWIARVISRMNYADADHILAVSGILKDYLVETGRVPSEKITVLPNASEVIVVEDSRKHEIRERYGLDSETTVGYVGTFQPWFGIENFITAIPQIIARERKIKFLFIGDGAAKTQAESRAVQLGVADRVRFIPAQPREKLEELLAILDIGVAPYRELPVKFYGSSMKVFDYMAGGCAIVASRIGQVAEVVRHEQTGLLVPPGDIPALANSILRLVRQPDLRRRLGAQAQQELQERYTWSRYADQLGCIYERFVQ
ncbi:MAG: glycosyltransferase family 4 protein [Candidatus Zhuqueibacterota bacterium]